MRKDKQYKKSLDDHSKKRAWQRYELDLTNEDLDILVRQIKEGEAEFLRGYSNSRTVHKVSFRNLEFPVLYSRSLKKIVTVLPEREMRK